MNYHIIPTNNFKIKINIQLDNEIKPIISRGLIFFMEDMRNQICNLQEYYGKKNEDVSIEYINQIINPFEFLHSSVPGSTVSVSKVKPESTIFFELMEIFQTFNINDHFSSTQKINICNLTHNHSSTTYLLDMLREINEDNIISSHFKFDDIYNHFVMNKCNQCFDLIICEFSPNDYNHLQKYIDNMILTLIIIFMYQTKNGVCFIKIDNIFYKPIIDIIFILSGIYDKVYLVKPSISNITKSDKYIVCKDFKLSNSKLADKLISYINDRSKYRYINEPVYIKSIIDNEIPYYILNRIEESNLIIGQQQMESFDQLINIFKSKNRDEKIDNLKKNHIQKCIQWCEKNQLPHNKFTDKINIFLRTKDS